MPIKIPVEGFTVTHGHDQNASLVFAQLLYSAVSSSTVQAMLNQRRQTHNLAQCF